MKNTLALFAMTLLAVCMLSLSACGASPSAESATDSNTKATADSSAELSDQKKAPANTSTSSSTSASSSALRVSFIDVGKGDCILVQEGDAAVLIDAGYESTDDDVLSHLQDQGATHLDAMVITHYDRDHIGGIRSIGEAMGVDTIYLPGYEGADKNYRSCVSAVKALGVPTKQVAKELTLDVGNARLTVFPSGVAFKPGTGGEEGNDNDVSLVATLVNGSDSYLFAGDLEEEGIDAYLKSDRGQFDVLKMPHHGQHSSNTTDLLDAVRPQIAIITDAKKDAADKKTLKLLKSDGVDTYRTSTDGTIVVESDGTGTYSVSTSNG